MRNAGVLSYEIKQRNEKYCMIRLGAGSSLIDLGDIKGPLGGGAAGKEGRNVDHFCIRVEPFNEQAILDLLRAQGIEAEEAVTRCGTEGNGPSIYCIDPDGNQIELKGPAESAAG